MRKTVLYLLIAFMLFTFVPYSLYGCNDTTAEPSTPGDESDNGSTVSDESEESIPMIIIKDNPDYANVALNKSYTRSSLYPDDQSASYPDENGSSMTDGVVAPDDAKYSHAAFMGFNKNSYDYVTNGYSLISVDLGRLHHLDKFVAHVASSYHLSVGICAPIYVVIFASEDNENWHQIGRTYHADSTEVSSVTSVLELESAISARYIQYRFVGDSNWIMVSEVEAYGITSDESIPYPDSNDEKIKFLCVGNSSTYFYNIPYEFMFIAEAAGIGVDMTLCTVGGAYLSQYADENDSKCGTLFRTKIKADKYDYVVLQDNSNADYNDSKPAMDILVPMIKENGAEILLYKRYSSNSDPSQRLDSSYRHELNYTRLASDFDIERVAPATDAFLICTEKYPSINLYYTDNSHHSAAGAYLIACVWAITYLDIDITDNTYISGLDAETARALRECAKIACEEGFDYPQDN